MQDADKLREAIAAHDAVIRTLADKQLSILLAISDLLEKTLRQGGTIFFCGNGGSAADAQHVAGEFVGRFLRERRPLPAVALTTNTSILTAIGNDYHFEQVFSRQIKAQVGPKDCVAGISTSGKSPNIISAMQAAREVGASTVGFTGLPGEPLGTLCDLCFKAESNLTPRIQEAHILAWHLICDIVEGRLVHAG